MQIPDSKYEMDSILTVETVAEYLRLHPSTVYRLLKGKQLPAFKLGREWRLNRESIDRWRVRAERNRERLNRHARQ
jgi:excisionase family DNA binding protein